MVLKVNKNCLLRNLTQLRNRYSHRIDSNTNIHLQKAGQGAFAHDMRMRTFWLVSTHFCPKLSFLTFVNLSGWYLNTWQGRGVQEVICGMVFTLLRKSFGNASICIREGFDNQSKPSRIHIELNKNTTRIRH